MSVYPLAEKYPNISPYVYVANNPINAIDPDGREIIYVIYNKDGSAKEELKYRNGNFYHNRGEGKRYNPGKESLSPNMYKVLTAYRKIEKSNDKELKNMLSTLADSKQTHYVTQGETNQNEVDSQFYPENDLRNYQARQDVKNGEPVDTMTHYDFSEESKKDYERQEGVPDSDFSTVVHEMRHQFDFDQGNLADSRGKRYNKSPAEKRAVDSENRARKINNLPKRTTYGGKKFDID
ncbi:RHS repeat-associated core domain-containing protein [Flavobacterium branchiophilum]